MRLLNDTCREIGIILSNEWIYQCPKCRAFAIGYTRPFINLKKFRQNHPCVIYSGPVFHIL